MIKKVFITGLGVVGPFGVGKEGFWKGISEGRNFLRPITRYDFNRIGGEVPRFSISEITGDSRMARLPLISQYALASAVEAVSDAGIRIKDIDQERMGISFGTCRGATAATERICTSIIEKGKKAVDPILFQQTVFNAPASVISIFYGIKGPSFAFPMGLAAGGFALISAVNQIRNGGIDCVLAIAADELSKVSHEAYGHLGVLSPNDDHEEGMRPFDKTRNGVVLSEGAVTLVLESEELARKRGVRGYAEVLGYGIANDAYRIADNNPDGSGLCSSIQEAFTDSKVDVSDTDYVVAISNSNKRVDALESRATKTVFGKRTMDIHVSSIKSSIGETAGPGALFNVAAGVLAMDSGIVPPTINYKYPDPDCDLFVVPNKAARKRVDTVLTSSFSWGGIYNSIVVRKPT